MDGSVTTEQAVQEQQTPMTEISLEMRMLEAMLFAATEPVAEASLADRLPEGTDVAALLQQLAAHYEGRGIHLLRVAGKWAFRTAPDLGDSLKIEVTVPRKLSRAAVETLAIIAYHQPVSRAEIEEIRGVALSKGTLDVLLEIGWIHPVGRRRTPGRPVTWGTTQNFLSHFSLGSLSDLPGIDELKAAGLLDTRPVRTIFGEVAAMQESEETADESDETDSEPLEPLEAELVEPKTAEEPEEEPEDLDEEMPPQRLMG